MFARRRPLLRAAVVGGGAYAMGRASANRAAEQDQRDAEQEARLSGLEAAQTQVPAQQAPAPSPAAGSSMMDQLSQLAALHNSGALTDDEFSAAKAKLLG